MAGATQPSHHQRQLVIWVMHLRIRIPANAARLLLDVAAALVNVGMRSRGPALALAFVHFVSLPPRAHVGCVAGAAVPPNAVALPAAF
jgi:hypothetical protein